MAKIGISAQGVKGGKTRDLGSKGNVTISIKDDNRKEVGYIYADAFNGFGDTYKRRDNSNIQIYSSLGVCEFSGTFDELLTKLKS